MITSNSRKREIKDLRRLLVGVGLMQSGDRSARGTRGLDSQSAVLLAFAGLGWGASS